MFFNLFMDTPEFFQIFLTHSFGDIRGQMKMENFEKTTYIIGKLRKKYVENAYQTIF